jgi:retron-type reverse transcriptase
MLRSLGATGTTGRTLVRDARIGTIILGIRTTTSAPAAAVSAQCYRFANAKALRADHLMCGQPVLSSFGKHSTRFGRAQSSEISKGAANFFMAKKHRNLIDQIVVIDNLRDAYTKTSKGKRGTFGFLEFKEYAEANLLEVQKELQEGRYKIGEYRQFTIFEPKERLISALDFKDRLVQHATCNVVAPIFEKTLMPYTFACRTGKGTHAGVKHIQASLRSTGCKYFLKTDFSKFFPSIDHSVLHRMIDRKISCQGTLNILREIIPQTGKGLPIGSLTSQLFANVYGGAVDRLIHFELGQRHWARYMDDVVILGDDPEQLHRIFNRIQEFSFNELGMRISKWQVSPISQGINFLGYRIWPTHKLLRKDSVIRAKRKIQRYITRDDSESLQKFLAAWSGHVQWADSNNLFNWMENRYGVSCN